VQTAQGLEITAYTFEHQMILH